MMTGDLPPKLDASRERFIGELGERLSALRQSLARFNGGSEPAGELNALRRRVHALAASAEVLRFQRAAEALSSAEAGLAGAGGWDPGPQVRERVGRILDLLPSLVLGAQIDLAELDNPRLEPLREPLCVVVYGDASLESLLHTPALQTQGAPPGIESHATRQPEQALELVTQLNPDVVLVDGDDPALDELLPRLRQASNGRPAAVVAVGSFQRHEPLARLIRRGVSRVLPKPTDALTLQRTLRHVTQSELAASARALHRRASSEQLLEALEQETRRAVRPSSAAAPGSVDPGSQPALQAAAWGALARVHALGQGQGAPSFSREGPSGALLLALDAPPRDSRPASTPVPLAGRRVVVADDDAAIRTLLGNALAELGATVLPARDGAEALDLAERHWPDALVSDTLMPELDGFELCRRLRQDIALSDLPVLLVAWREHLLACTRGPATGRALEQIDGEALAFALRECLAPRVALEQRLARHDAVHGRLDGLTPRLLLQMVCERSPNALLSVRSRRLVFELSVADGKPMHARWYEGDQPRGEGKCVLVPFLGIRAGRFSVEPLFSPPQALFEGDARAVLNPAAQRARRARVQVSPRHVHEIGRVVLDPLATQHYLAEFPAHAAVVEQLGSTTAFRRAIEDEASSRDGGRLSSVLAELASHGVIGALLDRFGNDLLPGGPAYQPGSTPPGASRRSSRPAPAARASQPPAPAARASQPPAPAEPSSLEARSNFEPTSDPDPSSLEPSSLEPSSLEPSSFEPSSLEPSSFEPSSEPEPRRSAPPPADDAFFPPRVATPSELAASELDYTPAPGKPEPPPPDQLAARSRESRAPAPASADSTAATVSATNASDALATARDFGADPEAADDDLDDLDSWPPKRGARLRAAAGRLMLSLAAAAAAFVGIRALAHRWEARNVALPQEAAATAALPGASAGATAALSPAGTSALSAPTSGAPSAATPPGLSSAGAPSAAASTSTAVGQPSSASYAALGSPDVPVELQNELLELAPDTKLSPGQGLLEVNSWQRRHIYVDGVFMGNYENRLIPLGPGTYQLKLSDGVREIEHAVEVKPGRRTRVSARPSAAP